MKKVFFALFAATFLFSVSAFAQVEEQEPEEQTQPQSEETVTAMAEEGMEIEFDQLPETVKTSFESSDYAAWDVKTVHEVSAEEGEDGTKYKITVSDGTKEEKVTFNEEGEEVEQY